jgi:NTP pyrophosphatase (non-canonical NTP hydrolase)
VTKIPVQGPEGSLSTEAVSFSPEAALREWHQAISVTKHLDQPEAPSRRLEDMLRLRLIKEEFDEVSDELLDFINAEGDRAKLAKELADLVYVIFGAADVHDIPLERVFNAVHASNMTKVGANGKVSRRADGKILKGPGYQEPDVASLL